MNQQTPEAELKTAEQIIRENESVYQHVANEPAFDCEMVDMALSDAVKHMQTFADQQSEPLHTRISELEGEVERLKKALEEILGLQEHSDNPLYQLRQVDEIATNALNQTKP